MVENKKKGYRYKETLNESQESESIKAAKKLYMQHRGVDEVEADRWVRIDLRGDIPALRSKRGGKFILGVTRMFLNGEIRTADVINDINTSIEYAASDAHIKEYDRNLNGLSATEFINKFADAVTADVDSDRNARYSEEYSNVTDYEIVQIDSFEEAQKYSSFTSWCVTHHENMYDSYTSSGIAQFYFCLKHGFETLKPVVGENCPLDEYGLSMIAVCVDSKGRLKTCTCRWNHDNGGNDHIMNTQQISQVINMNFYEVFKPNEKWGKKLAEINALVKQGKSPYSLFDFVTAPSEGFLKVKLGGNWNFIHWDFNSEHLYEFIGDEWFETATDFLNGIAAVKNNNLWNFINYQGQYISNEWFHKINWTGKPQNWIPVLKEDAMWYLINNKGEFMSKQGWNEIDVFNDGWARVRFEKQFNYINDYNQLISDKWFPEADPFHNGFACVNTGGDNWNYLTKNGKMLLPDGYADYVKNFTQIGRAFFRKDGKWGIVSNKGEVLREPEFRYVDGINGNYARVENEEGWNNYIKISTGELLLQNWVSRGRLPRIGKDGVYVEVYLNDEDRDTENICLEKFKKESLLNRIKNRMKNENKTIIISERQAQILKEHVLNEGLSPVIYHFTSLERLYEILLSQKFYLKSGVFRNTSDLGGGKRMFYLSTTRNKNAKEGYSERFNSETGVRITLDGEKLSQKYHGRSYNYWGDGHLGRMQYLNPEKVDLHKRWSDEMRGHRHDETEDRIWSYNAIIPDVFDYILRIDICLPEAGKLADIENRIDKAESEGKTEIVKSFTSSLEYRKQFEKRSQELIYDIYNLIGRRGILFLYDNPQDFAAGNNNTVRPEWLENSDYYEGYKERMSLHSVNNNYQTQIAAKNVLAYALAVMVFKEMRQNRQKMIVQYCKKYGFTEYLNGELFRKVDEILYRNSDIFEISREVDNHMRIDKESQAKIQNMVSHWMRKNGYYTIGDIIKESKEIKKVRQGLIAYEEREPDYEIGFEGPDGSDYAHLVNEETNPEDVDLSSFEIKNELNPKFWKNNKLDSRIRLKLLDIADDFVDSLNINWVEPEDITMTGSLANYTWDEQYSDIDLHIIMDYKKVDDKKEFVKNYFDAKKKEWNEKHKELKIFGFPIEVYVQDKNEPHKSSGIYSLEENDWVKEPDKKKFSKGDYNEKLVKKTVSDYMNQIDDIEDKFNKTEDNHQIEDIYDEADGVFDNIKGERKNAFKNSSKELSTGNVIFKTLRRNGYIEKISNIKDKTYDKINSLN